ncbi:MAG: DUF1330 domain-containing protein [Bacillota bacterium]
MSAYFAAQITIKDPETYEKYLEGYDEIFSKYKGKVIAVDDHPMVLEGSWSYTRFVLIRFPDEAELKRWYESPEYQQLAQYRRAASSGDILIVKGRE